MSGWKLTITMAVLRVLLMFVNEEEYQAKVDAIPSMDSKHAGFDLQGWEYRTLPSFDSSWVHRYYYYPSRKDDAPVFLFIHGLNLDGRTFMNLTELADRWQLVAYDLPEECPAYQGAFDDYMTIMYDFVERLGVEECCLGGVSFGAGIAIRLAAEHPTLKTRNLVLMSTTMVGAEEGGKKRNRQVGEVFGDLPDYKLYWIMETMVNRSIDDLPRTDTRDVRDVLRMKHPSFYRQVSLSIKDFDAGVYGRQLTQPVLMIMGTDDDLYTSDQEAMMRRYIPHIEYHTIEGATHSMVYMRGEQVAPIIKAFCMEHCGFEMVDPVDH